MPNFLSECLKSHGLAIVSLDEYRHFNLFYRYQMAPVYAGTPEYPSLSSPGTTEGEIFAHVSMLYFVVHLLTDLYH